MNHPSHAQPTLWLAGGTGLIGRELLELALADAQTRAVHILLRRAAPELPQDSRLQTHRVDFKAAGLNAQPALPPADALFIALGTTIKQAGSQESFRALDLQAVRHVAEAAKAAGVRRCAVVSALGADPRSGVFYNRVKGEMEAALTGLGFDRLLIARPSLLIGDRQRLGQAARPGELWGERLSRPLRTLIPARWRPIEAAVVARALWRSLAQDGPALSCLESDQLGMLGAQA